MKIHHPFQKAKILSLEALKERLPNSILLAIDLEGAHQGTELALAILVVKGDAPIADHSLH